MVRLKKIFGSSHFSLKKNGHLFGWGTGPEADWRTIFNFFILATLFFIFTSLYMFIEIDKGEIFTSGKPMVEAGQTLDVNLLSRVVSYYQGKSAQFEKLKSSKESVVDPSLSGQ